MGLLGINEKDFEAYQSKVEQRLANLQKQIDLKATDSEATAKEAAEKSIETLQVIQGYETKSAKLFEDLSESLDRIQTVESETTENHENLIQNLNNSSENLEQLTEKRNNIYPKITELEEKIDAIETAWQESTELEGHIENTKELLNQAKGAHNDIESLKGHALLKKAEIDDLYTDIYGEDITNDDDDTVEHIDGKVDQLDAAYANLSNSIDELNEKMTSATDQITDDYKKIFAQKDSSLDKILSNGKAKIDAVKEQLDSLLPGAMAAGLSSAYEAKKEDEVSTQEKLLTGFKLSLSFLVLISLIPFAVNTYLIAGEGKDLVEVIKDTPSLLLAILPLYLPILWFAYSSNKKLNLSKRLIEEYTHKAVLGKTFEGLSNQIESLPDENIRDELRTKLLFNLLQVSSENPGKLITNYEKSDHPLMEALENSARLSQSVDVLNRIPGMSAIADKLARKSNNVLAEQHENVEEGLAINEELEESKTS